MQLSELISRLTAIHSKHGDCAVFASLSKYSSQFRIETADHVRKDDPAWQIPPHQEWLPERVVLGLTNT